MSDTPKFPDGTVIEVGVEVEFELRRGERSPRWDGSHDGGSSSIWAQGKITQVCDARKFIVEAKEKDITKWWWLIFIPSEQWNNPGYIRPLKKKKKFKLVDTGTYYSLVEV